MPLTAWCCFASWLLALGALSGRGAAAARLQTRGGIITGAETVEGASPDAAHGEASSSAGTNYPNCSRRSGDADGLRGEDGDLDPTSTPVQAVLVDCSIAGGACALCSCDAETGSITAGGADNGRDGEVSRAVASVGSGVAEMRLATPPAKLNDAMAGAQRSTSQVAVMLIAASLLEDRSEGTRWRGIPGKTIAITIRNFGSNRP